MQYRDIQDDPEFLEFCERFGFDPDETESVNEYRFSIEERTNNPHA